MLYILASKDPICKLFRQQ